MDRRSFLCMMCTNSRANPPSCAYKHDSARSLWMLKIQLSEVMCCPRARGQRQSWISTCGITKCAMLCSQSRIHDTQVRMTVDAPMDRHASRYWRAGQAEVCQTLFPALSRSQGSDTVRRTRPSQLCASTNAVLRGYMLAAKLASGCFRQTPAQAGACKRDNQHE